MDAPSSDGVEVLEPSALASHRSATRPPPTATTSRAPARNAAPQLSNVIELSDGSNDEFALPALPPTRRARLDDDDVLVVGGSAALNPVPQTKRTLPDPSSDELPSANALWGVRAPPARTGAQPMGRSASLNIAAAGPSTKSAPLARAHTTLGWMSNLSSPEPRGAGAASSPRGLGPLPDRSSSPGLPNLAMNGKGKDPTRVRSPAARERGRTLFVPDEDAVSQGAPRAFAAPKRVSPQDEDDLWAEIVASRGTGTGAKGKGRAKDKGKGKEREESLEGVAGGQKRSLSVVGREGSEVVLSTVQAGRKKVARIAIEGGPAAAAAPAALSKTAQKKLETADRVRLRAANTLRAGDKHASTAELTMHISGRAFAAPALLSDSDDDEASGAGRKRARKRAPAKPSAWVAISREVRERLRLYACDVECPEVPRAGVCALEDVVEGAVRWTRVCDRVWSEERRMFLPLQDGEQIVVEEDSRLVFLTALELSTHVANGTLSAHIAALQARLAPHVNLFVLVYGLATLFRDMERARQEAYRNSVRADGAGERAVKPAGIGANQPGKDDLELELMRVQIQSRCMIVSVDKVSEAVDWLEQLTFDVGQKPYQRLKHSHVSLLGSAEDKVASGKDLQDTYIKMLAALPKVTEPVAKGIVAEYPTLRALYEAWAACSDEKHRREMLVGIGRGRNLDGTATHRAIGKDLSAAIYRIMTGQP
ncbi:hypothetical protein JCM3770_002158 [Rhodotorula araucariae]